MKDNGGPAFPFEIEHGDGSFTNYTGMTLRDWFAGQALSSISECLEWDYSAGASKLRI